MLLGWLEFGLVFILAVLILFLPGSFLGLSLGMRRSSAIALAPALSIVTYCVLGIIYTRVGIFASALSLTLPVWAVSAVLFLLVRHKKVRKAFDLSGPCRNTFRTMSLYVIFGLLFGGIMFVLPLDGPASSVQTYDNVFHFSLANSFLESGSLSSLDTSLYLGEIWKGIAPFSGHSYYPAAWHVLTASTASLSGASIGVSANAVNYAITSVVYPLACWCLIDRIFRDEERVTFFGAIVPCAIGAFPWVLIDNWPLYPNTLSLAILPLLIFSFIEACEDSTLSHRLLFGGVFLVCGVGQFFSQPNTVFSAAAFLTPYCVYRLSKLAGSRRRNKLPGTLARLLAGGGFLLFAVVVWIVCFNLPFFSELVSYRWDPVQTWDACVISILNLSFIGSGSQPVLSLLVVFGLVYSLIRRRYLWVSISYLFSCFLYFIAATLPESVMRHLLTGFWYTDPYRLAAFAGLCAVPVAAMGLFALFSVTRHFFARRADNAAASSVDRRALGISVGVTASFCVLGMFLGINGVDILFENGTYINDADTFGVLDSGEVDFIHDVKAVVPEDAIILNMPYDGSLFSYGLYDFNSYYHKISGYGGVSESSNSEVIRLGLCDLSVDQTVRDAVKSVGADYLLLLHRDPAVYSGVLIDYKPEDWIGINSIEDDTEGFEIVLADGDMRLYRLVNK